MQKKNIWSFLRSFVPDGLFYRVSAIPYRESGDYRFCIDTVAPSQRIFVRLNRGVIDEYLSDDSCIVSLSLSLSLGENELRWKSESAADWRVIKLWVTKESLLHASLADVGLYLVDRTSRVFYLPFLDLSVLNAWLADDSISDVEQAKLLKQLYFIWGDSWRAVRQKAIGEGKSRPYFIDKVGKFIPQRNLVVDEFLLRDDSYSIMEPQRIKGIIPELDPYGDFGVCTRVQLEEEIPQILSSWFMFWWSRTDSCLSTFVIQTSSYTAGFLRDYEDWSIVTLFDGEYVSANVLYAKLLFGRFFLVFGRYVLLLRFIDEGKAVYLYDAVTRQSVWSILLPTGVDAYYATYDSGVIFLIGFVGTPPFYTDQKGYVCVLDSSTGEELWRGMHVVSPDNWDSGATSGIYYRDGSLYYWLSFYSFPAAEEQRVVKLSSDGYVSWIVEPSEGCRFASCPILFDTDGNPLIVCLIENSSDNFALVKLDRLTGQVLSAIGSGSDIQCGQVYDNGDGTALLYWTDRDSYRGFILVCIDVDSLDIVWAKRYDFSPEQIDAVSISDLLEWPSIAKTSYGYQVSFAVKWAGDEYWRGSVLEVDAYGTPLAQVENLQVVDITNDLSFGDSVSVEFTSCSSSEYTRYDGESLSSADPPEFYDLEEGKFQIVDITRDYHGEENERRFY